MAAASSSPAIAIRQQDGLADAIRSGRFGAFSAISDCAACLMPLLHAMRWSGGMRRVAESMPHFADSLSLAGLRNVLANLNYKTAPHRVALDQIDPRLMPCLFVPDGGSVMVVFERQAGGIHVFDGTAGEERVVDQPDIPGTAYFLSAAEEHGTRISAGKGTWFNAVIERFRGIGYQMLGITFMLNMFALAVPIFIMMVYDRVIPAASIETLAAMGVAVLLALICDLALRMIRARALAYVGARFDVILINNAFQHILALPSVFTERAPVSMQVSRLKQFESIREFFTGPLAAVALDIPFSLVFLAVIAAVGGWLAAIPIVMMVLFGVMGLVFSRDLRERAKVSGDARAKRESFLVEAISNLRSIKQAAAEDTWVGRYRELSAESAMARFRAAQTSFLIQSLSHAIMVSSGVAVVGFGAVLILEGDMTVGGLVATMALVWRLLSPLQTAFTTLPRIESVRQSIDRLNQLMRMKTEPDSTSSRAFVRDFQGRISFSRVSIRYRAEDEPALLGASFDIAPGSIVAITGPNGSGKSTILKLVARIYQPQAGTVRIDDIDTRQLDLGELRDAIAYVPQERHLFHGTIAQNMRLSEPTASEADLMWAAEEAGVLGNIVDMPEGFQTRIGDYKTLSLPAGFAQRLCLARAFLKKAPIVLLDEPANALDQASDKGLVEALHNLKGKSTVLMVTHRPSHMKLADRMIVLNGGVIAHDGTPDEGIDVLRELSA